jgi:hypothetical protein
MQLLDFARSSGVLLACGVAAISFARLPQSSTTGKATPLILEENEGERRVVRGWPGHPEPGETFILKVEERLSRQGSAGCRFVIDNRENEVTGFGVLNSPKTRSPIVL